MKQKFFLSIIIFLSTFFLSTLQAKVWQREAPDSTGREKGAYCSLAIDSENNPHIAYYDEDFSDLRYAYYRDGIWTIEIVDSVEDAGQDCSLALDSHNRPHISYQQRYLGYYWSLKYATKTDTGWVTILLDTPKDTTYAEVGEHSSIAIDKNDYPYISYLQYSPTKIKLAYKDGSGWHFDLVSDVYSCNFTKIVLDSADYPVIGFHHWEPEDTVYHNRLKIAYFNPHNSSWSVVTVPDSIGNTYYGSLIGFDMDSQNKAYFAYLKYWDDFLRLAVYDGQNWSIETVSEDPGPYSSPGLTLKVDRFDQPAIVCFYYSDEVRFYQKVNAQWHYQMVDNVVTCQEYCSLDFTSENYPCIAIQGETRNYTRQALFYYRYWPGNSHIYLPEISHNFGSVWTQSYADWNCAVENHGDAPLIINHLELISPWWDTTFQIIKTPLPKTILPQRFDFISLRFKPRDEATFYDTLRISSNDSLQLETQVYLEGRGMSSGATGNLQLTVNNVYINHSYRQLRSDLPLSQVKVRLYQNGQATHGPFYTSTNGQLQIPDIVIGDYDVKLTKAIQIPGDQPNTTLLDSLTLIRSYSIGPGGNSLTIFFPESLFIEKYQYIYNLTHIEKTSWNYTATFRYSDSETKVQALLNLWKSNLPVEVEGSLSRLILDEYMVFNLFDPSYRMGVEFMHDVGELINMVLFSDQFMPDFLQVLINFSISLLSGDPLSAIVGLVLDLVRCYIQSHLLNLIGEGIQQAAALLPNEGEQIVMAAWHDICARYSTWGTFLGGLSSQSWSHMKGLIYDHFKTAIFQGVYIDLLTDNIIEKGKNYSQHFQYNGEFTDSYDNSDEFVADKLGDIETAQSICEGLRISADLFNAACAVLDIIGLFPIPGLGLLEALNTAMKISAYVQVLSAIGISAYEFFSIPDDMDETVDNIYFPDGKPLAYNKEISLLPHRRMNPEIRSLLINRLWQSMDNYDATITAIKQQIAAGEVVQALIAMDDLMESEIKYQNDLKSILAPIYAVAKTAQDSLENFTAMYDSIISYYAQAGENRFKNYLAILFLPTDTSQAMKDTVIAFLDRSIPTNHMLTEQVITTFDSVSTLPIPAILLAKSVKQSQYELKSNETATIQIQVENVGSLPAHGVSICLKTNSALRVEQADSIYLGTLSPGQISDTITWTVSLFGSGYTRGTWTAEVYSSDAKTYSASGAFVISQPSTPPTGGKLSNANIYNYPNPFNPDKGNTTLRYSLEKTAKVTIKIYDAGGNLVITLLDAVLQQSGEEQSVVWDGKNSKGDIVANGVYFNVIETSENERAVGKIAVLR